ncbi:MAG: hypothetical protein GX370_00845 [Clostridia bacterium]|jgi:hypothetical protein|nr:hypothetical protein [Clostridia bacterium]
MKKVAFSFLIICMGLLFTNYPAIAYNFNNIFQDTETEGKRREVSQDQIVIIRSVTTLKPGDVGLITIKGKPHQRYTIETSYKAVGRTIPVRQWRTADSQGMASFTWVVENDTDIGRYKATIYGPSSSLSLTHTVIS